MNNKIDFLPEVQEALEKQKPIIALESTLIAHGFPYPENIKLARQMEDYLRQEGVVPATIAIIAGRIKIGLGEEELEYIARGKDIHKASLRDIPVLLAKGLSGGTTVAGTMRIAAQVGIKIFVTGGIGGVHIHGEDTMDVSADLEALARYHLLVVCAGAKSILDLARTRERLETLGVPVLGYQSQDFPAFYLRKSGLKVDYQVDQVEEAIDVLNYTEGGVLLTTPIPEEAELDQSLYQGLINSLLQEAEEKGIKGKELTPYLLAELGKRTAGASIKANISLIMNNLRVGALLSKKYYQGAER